jgi:hypothetical protein
MQEAVKNCVTTSSTLRSKRTAYPLGSLEEYFA